MFKRRFRLPSPALVISMVTLSLVLGGTAFAASTATHKDKKADTKLIKKLAPASVNRTITGLKAAFSLAAEHDERITNRRAWESGLASIPDAEERRVFLERVPLSHHIRSTTEAAAPTS